MIFFETPADVAAITLAKNTIETSYNVLILYNSIDSEVPWSIIKSAVSQSDQLVSSYSKESAPLVGEIVTNLLDINDKHFAASHHIKEWTALIVPFLKSYVQLFTDHSASIAHTQNRLLQKVLNDGLERIKMAQADLEIVSKSFYILTFSLLPKLFKQVAVDFDEKSKFFKTKLLVKTIGSKKISVNGLKEYFAGVTQFFINLNNVIIEASSFISRTKTALKIQIEIFEVLHAESKKLENFESIADDRRLIDSVIRASQDLIGRCIAYQKSHRAL